MHWSIIRKTDYKVVKLLVQKYIMKGIIQYLVFLTSFDANIFFINANR
jgi:hypothetical protein